LDDRDERPGVKFKDADLIGIPWRVVVGDKNLAGDTPRLEVKRRGEQESRRVEVVKAARELAGLVREEMAVLNE
jgi:prolyl-tRNA synthetase